MRHFAIIGHAHRTAEMIGQVLGLLTQIKAVADINQQRIVGQKDHARAIMDFGVLARCRFKNCAYIFQCCAGKAGANDPERIGTGGADRERQIHITVLRIIGMDHNIHQSALPAIQALRHAGDSLRHQLAIPNMTQIPGQLGNQHVAIGQYGQAPRAVQTVNNGFQIIIGKTLRCCLIAAHHAVRPDSD